MFAWSTAPPEPIAIHLVVRPEQNRDSSRLQLPKVSSNHIHLLSPPVVDVSARCEQFVPFEIGQMALHTVSKSHRLVIRRPHRMPCQCDDRAATILPDCLL